MREILPPRALIQEIRAKMSESDRPKQTPESLLKRADSLYQKAAGITERFAGDYHWSRRTNFVARVYTYEQETRFVNTPPISVDGRTFILSVIEEGDKRRTSQSKTVRPHEIWINGYVDGNPREPVNIYKIVQNGVFKGDNLLTEIEEYEEVDGVLGFIEQLLENRQ